MIEFRTFGALDLSGPNGREYRGVLTQPKRVALLAYLATAAPHRFHRRDSLLALFWPELDKDHARAALRQALHGLRRALGADAVASRGDDDVAVDERALWSDVRAFDQAVAADDHAAALGLYRGDFLTGFFLSGAREFEQWVESERARLRRAACRAASVLAQRCQTAGDSGRAAEYARRALSLAPDDEGLLRQLITVLDALGDRAGAVAAYEGFARQLMGEFAAEPSVETQRLITAVRSRELTAAPPDQLASGPKEKALPRFEVIETPKAPSSVRPRLPGHLIATLAAAVMVGFAGVALALRRTTRPPLEPRRVAVATFANRTGDSALNPLGSMAADWIERGLAQTGLLEIADPLWSDTAHRTGDSVSAQAIAAAGSAGTVVWGSFYRQGDSIRFEGQISDARTWTLLGSVTPVTAPIGDPTRAIEALRQRVTASLATRFDPKLRDWAEAASQPPTYEAYQEFLAGLEAFQRFDAREALRHYYRAAGMDSTYTLPLVEAAGVHRYLRECAQVDSIGLRFASRRPLPRIERYLLDRFLAECHGDLAAAYRLSRLNAAALAGSDFALASLGRDALMVNRPREAVAALEQVDLARGSQRGTAPNFLWYTSALHLLGEHERELRVAQQAHRQFPDNLAMLRLELFALAALGRTKELADGLDEIPSLKPAVERRPSSVMRETALELRAHGFAEAARVVLHRAILWSRSRPPDEQATEFARFELAQTLAAAGLWDRARPLVEALVAEHPDSASYQGLLGVLAAQRGDRLEAERVSTWLATVPWPYFRGSLTYWRAAIAARLGEPAEAVRLLREAYGQGLAFGTAPQGRGGIYGQLLHADVYFEPLHEYPPFLDLLRPKG